MDRHTIIRDSQKRVRDVTMGKRVLFITTKELSYIRNAQEIKLLRESVAKLKIIGSESRSYPLRLLQVYWHLLISSTKEYDIIFIGFAPQLILPFWKFRFRKSQVVIDFFISMYDTFVNDRKRFSDRSPAARLLKKLDQNTLQNADRIICDTNAHGRYFTETLGADRDKLLILYLEADKTIYYEKKTTSHNAPESGDSVVNLSGESTQASSPSDKLYYPRETERPEKLKDKFIVLYFGSVLPLQGVEVVLEAYRLLKDDDRFYFYMIGPVKDGYKKPESKNIEYIDWLPQKELADYIAMADLCLAGHFNGNIEKAKRTIPGKAYIYDAMGKAMILGDNEANRELFSENAGNISYVKMGDAEALKNGIEKVLNNKA